MSRGHFIGLNHHRVMLADRSRMEAYERAIAACVRPGMRVLDLGTGTGILAMWAARAGAQVVAVEPHDIIAVARRVAEANALGDRIRFVQADSRALELATDEKVDLVITECMGNFFVTDEMQPVLRDLPRLLAPGGATLPRRIRLSLALATLPLWREIRFWQEPIGGFDYGAAEDFARQSAYVVACEPELLISEPAQVVDFALIDAPDSLRLEARLDVTRSCKLDAIVGWFDADLAEGIVLSTAPGNRTHWGQMAFPVPPVAVVAGETVAVTVELVMDAELRSHFRWSGTIDGPTGRRMAFSADTRRRFAGGTGEPEARS